MQDNTGVLSSSCTVVGNTVTATVVRATDNGQFTVSPKGSAAIAWAVGADFADFSAGHEAAAVSNVDFATGTATAAGRKPLHVAHGALNFIAWGVLLPLGVLLARHTKHIPATQVGGVSARVTTACGPHGMIRP